MKSIETEELHDSIVDLYITIKIRPQDEVTQPLTLTFVA